MLRAALRSQRKDGTEAVPDRDLHGEKKGLRRLPKYHQATDMIEIACLVIAVASVVIAVQVNRIAKLLEDSERRETEARRVRSLESIKP
jgi:hypothetical protein